MAQQESVYKFCFAELCLFKNKKSGCVFSQDWGTFISKEDIAATRRILLWVSCAITTQPSLEDRGCVTVIDRW